MAGPHTEVLSNAMELLRMKRVEGGPPGSGVPFEVTAETMSMLGEIKELGKRIVVTDAGDLEVQ